MDDDPLQLIEDCERRSERLDSWSLTFIDSVRRQLESNKALTRAQVDKLNEIWERATARG